MSAVIANVVVIFMLYHITADGSPVVNITNWGMARGFQYSLLGKSVNVFYGLPFARPPIGNLRFSPPDITPKPWSGIKNFTKPSASCMQPRDALVNATNSVLDENCLHLNVFTPGNVTSSSKLAVMIWIHGGRFVSGTGSIYDGAMLATQHQMNVVTINYRLGIFGFFNIPGTPATGNYGLLDQIAAFKWVQFNIEQFGGDPEMVTIFGESAGSASVSLHVLSSLSTGLFKRAISESGTANCDWAVSPSGLNDSFAKRFGVSIGCNDINTLLDCLKSKSAGDIMAHQNTLTPLTMPNVDNHFLTAHPWELIMKNKFDQLTLNNVDYLLGFNLNEGTIITPTPPVNKTQFEKIILDNTQSRRYPGRKHDAFLNGVSYKYTDWTADEKTPLRWFKNTAEFLGDFLFKMPAVEFVNAWTLTNRTAYVYQFSYPGQYPTIPILGVTHAWEIQYVFGTPFYPVMQFSYFIANYTEADRNVSRNMMKMWAAFAKNGSPGFGWPKYTRTSKEYFNITLMNKVGKNWKPDVMAFWTDLVPKLTNVTTVLTCKPPADSEGFQVYNEIKLWIPILITSCMALSYLIH